MEKILTIDIVRESILQGKELSRETKLNASRQDFQEIGDLKEMRSLKGLNLSHNQLHDYIVKKFFERVISIGD